jgi:hypothetical protein
MNLPQRLSRVKPLIRTLYIVFGDLTARRYAPYRPQYRLHDAASLVMDLSPPLRRQSDRFWIY